MITYNIPFSIYKKENHTKFSQIFGQGIFTKGLKNEFETAVVNEPSVFEPLKFYCRSKLLHCACKALQIKHLPNSKATGLNGT